MPNGHHLSRSLATPDTGARTGEDGHGSCSAACRGGRIAAGSDGRVQGTTAAGQFGAEGVRDLRLLVQMAVLATPTELERLAAERDGLIMWLARQFPDVLSVEDAEDLVADALPVLAADPRLPNGARRRRNYLRSALNNYALEEFCNPA